MNIDNNQRRILIIATVIFIVMGLLIVSNVGILPFDIGDGITKSETTTTTDTTTTETDPITYAEDTTPTAIASISGEISSAETLTVTYSVRIEQRETYLVEVTNVYLFIKIGLTIMDQSVEYGITSDLTLNGKYEVDLAVSGFGTYIVEIKAYYHYKETVSDNWVTNQLFDSDTIGYYEGINYETGALNVSGFEVITIGVFLFFISVYYLRNKENKKEI